MKNFNEELREIIDQFKIDLFGMSDKDAETMLQEKLTSLVKGIVPQPKQVRYEDIKRSMGLDGKIIETEKNISYSKEDEAFNSCRSEMLKKLED